MTCLLALASVRASLPLLQHGPGTYALLSKYHSSFVVGVSCSDKEEANKSQGTEPMLHSVARIGTFAHTWSSPLSFA